MTTTLTTTAAALDRLNKSASRNSLDDLVNARTRRSLLLVDCSSSMRNYIRTGGTRIEALRQVVTEIRETQPVPVAEFSGRGVQLVNTVPAPTGGTPMDAAIEYGTRQEANHLVIVTDGEPSCGEWATLEAAKAFGGPIDTFFVGDRGTRGESFARELAAATGGTFNTSDLSAPKQLGAKIAGLLGAANETI